MAGGIDMAKGVKDMNMVVYPKFGKNIYAGIKEAYSLEDGTCIHARTGGKGSVLFEEEGGKTKGFYVEDKSGEHDLVDVREYSTRILRGKGPLEEVGVLKIKRGTIADKEDWNQFLEIGYQLDGSEVYKQYIGRTDIEGFSVLPR